MENRHRRFNASEHRYECFLEAPKHGRTMSVNVFAVNPTVGELKKQALDRGVEFMSELGLDIPREDFRLIGFNDKGPFGILGG